MSEPTQVSDPMRLVGEEHQRARAAGDPYAEICFLATVSSGGRPAVRSLVLRGIDSHGFTVFLNSSSPKWAELEHQGRCELLLYWSALAKQYRVRGTTEPLEPSVVGRSWAKKPYVAKLYDWLYEEVPQSQALERSLLHRDIERLAQTYPLPDAVPVPPSARGLVVVAAEIERLDLDERLTWHDRRLFTRTDNGWSQQVMVP